MERPNSNRAILGLQKADLRKPFSFNYFKPTLKVRKLLVRMQRFLVLCANNNMGIYLGQKKGMV